MSNSDVFARQMEIADYNRTKDLATSGVITVQVHEKERQAICKTLPFYLLFNICTGVLFWLTFHYSDQSIATLKHGMVSQGADQEQINFRFFGWLHIYSSCILWARLMLACKIPSGAGARKCVIRFFVFIRVIIVLTLIFQVFLFYNLAYIVISYTINEYQGDYSTAGLKQESDYNRIVTMIVQGFFCIFALLHLVFFIVAPIKRCFDNRRSRSPCSQFSYDVTGSLGSIGLWVWNFLYPSARFDEETEFTEAKSMKLMQAESVTFDRNTTVNEFLQKNTQKFSSFQDIYCPKCEALLEDDELIVKLQCNCTYHRGCIEEILRDGEDNCLKCGEGKGIIPKEDLEAAGFVEPIN